MSALTIAEAMLRSLEGCRLAPYRDVAGLPTIGVGCRYLLDGSPVTMATPPITIEEADALLGACLAGTVARVDAAVRVPLEDCQRAALYSFAYNVGCHAFEGSTLLRVLNAGNALAAAGHFAEWDKAGGRVCTGLVSRRKYERSVYLGMVNPLGGMPKPAKLVDASPAPKPVPAPQPDPADALNAAELARVQSADLGGQSVEDVSAVS